MLNYFSSREARPASAAWNLGKTLLQTVVFWFVFLGLIPFLILTVEAEWKLTEGSFGGPVAFGCGAILFVAGGLLGPISSVFMAICGGGTPLPTDCARRLVIAGPYRYIRNPMAIAGLTQGIAVGLMLGSPGVIAYALSGGPIWHYGVRPWEEADLEYRFGDEYRRYREAVCCWWPRVTAYRPN